MDPARRHAGRRMVLRSLTWGAVVSLGVLLTAAGVTAAVARHVITPPRRRPEPLRVVAVDGDARTITLTRHPETASPGRYGLWLDGDRGYAKVGDVVSCDEHTVVRELISIDEGEVTPGMRGRFSGWFHRHPSELGCPHSEVLVPTELGEAPAWLIEPQSGSARWVILVHGRGVDRRECLRAVPVFARAGFTCLLVSYRNDGVAPASPDGLYGLGDVEWRDVDAAMEYARSQGARELLLMGWSMGGATVLQAATRSRHARMVTGLVLESPVVDWVTALEHQAGLLRIPRIMSMAVYRMLSRPWGRVFTGQQTPIDLRRLDFVARAMELRLPILILHSSGDLFVPNTASTALARARPDLVTFPMIEDAGHARVWNVDEERWDRLIGAWLAALPPIRRRASR